MLFLALSPNVQRARDFNPLNKYDHRIIVASSFSDTFHLSVCPVHNWDSYGEPFNFQ